jgi:hypothetical protein
MRVVKNMAGAVPGNHLSAIPAATERVFPSSLAVRRVPFGDPLWEEFTRDLEELRELGWIR